MYKKLFWMCFMLLATLHGASAQGKTTLKVASYNLRYDSPNDSLNPWRKRAPVITDMVRFYDFDVMGTQEGLHHQLQDLLKGLPNYAYIGVGRDNGKQAGEYAAIFYKKGKYKVLKTGNFWLSPVTDKPNKGWDAALPRLCTWAEFEEVASGRKFYFFNTHFDHVGVQARQESAKLILSKTKALVGNQPVILSGDFNVDQLNESYLLLQNSDLLQDAYTLAEVNFATTGTFNGFDINANTGSRIDHIFVSKQFKVNKYAILTDSYHAPLAEAAAKPEAAKGAPSEITLSQQNAKLPSDHYPVVVELVY